MKAGWKTKKLENVCLKITDGSHFSPKTIETGYPYITVRDVDDDKIDFKKCKFINQKDYDKLSRNGCKPQKGDVLFSKDGTVGKVTLVDYERDFVVLSSLAIVRPNNELINSRYLKFLMKAPYFLREAIGKKTGVAIRRIVLRNLKTIPVPYPPLPEQKRIVAILDEAFAAIATATANAEKNLKNARELFESCLNSVFTEKGEGWVEKKLGDVCIIKPPKREAKETLNSTDLVSFVPMQYLMIGQKYFDVEQERTLEKVSGSYTYFSDGDVLLAKITPCFENGKLGIARNLRNSTGFGSSEYIVFRPADNLSSDFLYYYLSRKKFRKEGKPKMTGAVGHKRVPKDFIENYPIYIPETIDEQNSIVAKLDELATETKRLEAIYQKKLDALAELKQSILQKAFAGELTAETPKIKEEAVA